MKAFRRRVILAVAFLLAVMALVASQAALAVELHEDPDAARTAFSGISLFRYYSTSLDFVLSCNPAEVRARLEKMPFANLPQSLEPATADFVSSIIDVSGLVGDVDSAIENIRQIERQSRSDEAAQLGQEAVGKISQALSLLDSAERAVVISGKELKVIGAPEGSELKTSYYDVLTRIDRIRQAFEVEKDTLATLNQEIAVSGKSLISTRITLGIDPDEAFVGDEVHFEGDLTTAGGEVLGGRQVLILAGGLQLVNVITDVGGKYRGTLAVHPEYVSELILQSLYLPGGEDVGVYASSISPGLVLKVLFYEASLKLTVGDKAFPGREIKVSGTFDYGGSPPLGSRIIEVYLDDVFAVRTSVQPTFDIDLKLDTGIDLGKHVVSISGAAAGRYAPVVSSAGIEVSREMPLLDLNMPGVVMIPGAVNLSGRLYSELGPVENAPIDLRIGNSWIQAKTMGDGTFAARINLRPDLGLVEWRDLQLSVTPREPWHAPLKATMRMLAVNWVNCGAFLAALVFLGIYIPRRLRKKAGMRLGTGPKPSVIPPVPRAEPAVADAVVPAAAQNAEPGDAGPGGRILNWYRMIVRRILNLTRLTLLPRQTLREFAFEVKGVLGPAAQPFLDLTGMVERLLYSRQGATDADAARGQRLYRNIEQETGRFQIAARSIIAGERVQGVQSETGAISDGLASEMFGTALTLKAWLWTVLFLAVTYYAVLLYVLLLLISR